MKRNELIAILRKKSETIFNRRKNDNVPMPAAHADPMAQVMEALKQIAAKQDAIAHALVQIQEHFDSSEATDEQIEKATLEVNKILHDMGETKSAQSDETPIPSWPATLRNRWK